MKNQVTIGTAWQDRSTGTQFEVTGRNEEAGTIQLSTIGANGDYKVMKESSLRKNYTLIALKAKEVAVTAPTPQPVVETHEPEDTSATKPIRAAGGRVQLKDGTVIPGSKFITQICGVTREDSYKVDSPIRWLAKPDGAALLQKHEATIVTGVKRTK